GRIVTAGGDAEHLVSLEGDRPDRQAHDEGDDGVAGGSGAGKHHPPDEESDDERAEDAQPDGVEDRHPSALPSTVVCAEAGSAWPSQLHPAWRVVARRRYQPNGSGSRCALEFAVP